MDRLLPDQEHEDDVCLLVVRVLPAGVLGRRPRAAPPPPELQHPGDPAPDGPEASPS